MVGREPVRIFSIAVLRVLPVALIGLLSFAADRAGAAGERFDNRVAVFSALDKVTATIKTLEIPINETRQFGALKVTPRVCYSRPATEQPKTTSFVEVDEVGLDNSEKRIFSGWMFAESPGLNAVEHPVFDVWLTGCEKPKNSIAQQQPPAAAPAGEDAGGWDTQEAAPGESDAYDPQLEQRRRVRR